MKRFWIFVLSIGVAMGVAFYTKKAANSFALKSTPIKTFEKNLNKEISSHQTTQKELAAVKLDTNTRGVAQEKIQNEAEAKKRITDNYNMREDRILIGEVNQGNFKDEKTELEMINKVNPDWKEVLGHDLLRFHDPETKVVIKEELSAIKIVNGKGQYLEQVLISYLFKNGKHSSYRALVDSDTSFVVETWDRTIFERNTPETSFAMPQENNSGIIVK